MNGYMVMCPFFSQKEGAVGRQTLPSLDKRVLFGEDAVIALDPVHPRLICPIRAALPGS